MRVSILAAAIIGATIGTAEAQPADAMLKCVAIADDAQRLACYDAAMASASAEARAAAAERQAAAAEKARRDAEAAAQAKTDKFGAEGVPEEARSPAAKAADAERVDKLEATVAEMLRDAVGNAIFILDNGQMWRQTDGLQLPPLRAGEPVRITRGMVGGYRLTLPKRNRAVTVKRMR